MTIGLRRVINGIRNRYLVHRDPVEYARQCGVQLDPTSGVKIYGARTGMFGSEPWMIRLGAMVHIAGECQFITHDGGVLALRDLQPDLEWSAPIVVGDHSMIGYRSTIMPGVRIGERCIVAAGSVVTKDVPDATVVGGVPARHMMTTQEYFSKMKQKSLEIGHMPGPAKEVKLREIYSDFLAGGG